MVSTKLIGKLFVSRQKEIDRYAKEAEAIQNMCSENLYKPPPLRNGERNIIMPTYVHTLIFSVYLYNNMMM